MNFHPLKRSRGFTLIEIMVALALFGLIVAAVYSSWMAIVKGSEAGNKAAANVQRSRIAMRTLEDALLSVQSFAGDIEYYTFDAENGDDASLSFAAKLPRSFLRSGRFGDFDMRRVTFSVEQGTDGKKELVLRQTPLLMDMDTDEKEHPIVLAKDVKEFKMEFWDVRSGDWLDEWTLTNQLPPMVKITLSYNAKNQQSSSEAQKITRVVSLPSITVPPAWQAPGIRPHPRVNRPGQGFP